MLVVQGSNLKEYEASHLFCLQKEAWISQTMTNNQTIGKIAEIKIVMVMILFLGRGLCVINDCETFNIKGLAGQAKQNKIEVISRIAALCYNI